jgi:hypothetical protein
MLTSGVEPEVLGGFKSKIADGVYRVAEASSDVGEE